MMMLSGSDMAYTFAKGLLEVWIEVFEAESDEYAQEKTARGREFLSVVDDAVPDVAPEVCEDVAHVFFLVCYWVCS